MTQHEWNILAERINSDIAGIARARLTLSSVKRELRQRIKNPVEEDFIDRDSFAEIPGKARTFRIGAVEISVRKLHRRGISCSDIKGADLIYEVVGKKFALIQYKSPNKQDRIILDNTQLDELIQACPNFCPPHQNGSQATCGSWYAIQSVGASSYLQACQVKELFGNRASRSREIFSAEKTQVRFHKEFAECLIGARTALIAIDDDLIRSSQDHIIVYVKQHNI